MPQNRLNELINPKSLRRSAGYVSSDISEKDVNELAKAVESDNKSAIKRIITNNTSEDFLGNLFEVDGYSEFILEVGKQVVSNNRGKLSASRQAKMSEGAYDGVMQEAPLEYAPIEKVKVHRRKGSEETYEKSKNLKFTKAETTFFQRNKNRPLKEVQALHKTTFPDKPRSMQSVKFKLYRTRNTDATKYKRKSAKV